MLKFISAILVSLVLASCAAPPEKGLSDLGEDPTGIGKESLPSRAQEGVSELLGEIGAAQGRREALSALSLAGIIRAEERADLVQVRGQLVLMEAGGEIGFLRDSVVVAQGSLDIAHSANSVIVTEGDANVSHDGSMGKGSVILARGKVRISHAHNTLVLGKKGVDIAHATGVRRGPGGAGRDLWGAAREALVSPLLERE